MSRWFGYLPPGGLAAGAALWICLAALPATLSASPTDVVKAVFSRSGGGWHVSVTLRHADTGWKHYANVWVVETLDGKELGRRVLFHPHENEQPFTRSHQVNVPAGITKVRVRAGDKPNGMNSNTVVVDLSKKKGERFEVR
jgi:hypothetical protein